MDTENIIEKIELMEAVTVVAEFWGVEPSELVSFVASDKPEKTKEWNKIADEVKKFYEMGLEERMAKIGFKLSKEKE